jgi:Xaa-Pro dipeptidase
VNAESISTIQKDLQQLGISGWLFVNHHSLDPIATDILALSPAKTATRRWWYYVPEFGKPVKLVHFVEANMLDSLPGETLLYTSYRSLNERLAQILAGGVKVAMQYSPYAQLPMISLVDGGTIELVRSLGVSVVSSGELIQRHYAQLSDEQIQSHARAMTLLHTIKKEAFEIIRRQAKTATPASDLSIQRYILSRFDELCMTCDGSAPIVAVNESAADPHFSIDPNRKAMIRPGDRVLLDLWGRVRENDSVYADICWCAYVGSNPPESYESLFNVAVTAREQVVEFLNTRLSKGESTTGADVDRITRAIFEENRVDGYALHRTGHSIDTSVHGRGANIDSYETNDTRLIIPRTCFSIEPGLYATPIGVRSEINVIVDAKNSVLVFGERQKSLVLLN